MGKRIQGNPYVKYIYRYDSMFVCGYTAPSRYEAEMSQESEGNGKESQPDEDKKQPYEMPTVTKHLITPAQKQKFLEDQEKEEKKNDKSKGRASGSG